MADPSISAVVVCRNEAHLLPQCLASLAFCDEVMVVDLASTDESATIADRSGARVLRHPPVDFVEKVREFAFAQARFDWIVSLDPDEVVSPRLAEEIRRVVGSEPRAGAVVAPELFYFRGRPLRGTVWGGLRQSKTLAIHRERVDPIGDVHAGYATHAGYENVVLPQAADCVHHYWANGRRELIGKHLRYAQHEGRALYNRGARFDARAACQGVPRSFVDCFYRQAGYRDGITGFCLSIFWSWYTLASSLSLRRYERAVARSGS